MFDDIEIAKIAQQMNSENGEGQPEEEPDADDVPDTEDDVDPDAEGSDEDTDEDSDDEDSDEDSDDEDEPEAESKKDPLVKWKTSSGEEFSVKQSELKLGYMRTQDYTHKTQELAKERETVAQQVQAKFQLAEQYAQELGMLTQHDLYIKRLETNVSQINSQDDPIGYTQSVSELMMARQQREGLATQIAQVQRTRTQEQRDAMIEAQKQAVKQLAEGPQALPGFGPELVKKLNSVGKDYGLTDQELSGITDAKYIRILHDAMKYRELQAKKPEAKRKAAQAPAKRVRSATTSKARRAIENFDKSPSVEAMAALLNSK